jgi:polyhydroxybutyrate depolymerase
MPLVLRGHARRVSAVLSAGLASALLVAVAAQSEGGPLPTGPRYPVIVHRGANLPPPSSAKPVPLILGFHATGGSPQDFEATAGLDAVADEHGFVVAYLSGRRPTKPTWKLEQLPENLPYVTDEIEQLIATQNIDPTRIYATGFSAGATMSFELGCQLSNKLAGIAVVSGAMLTAAPPCKIAHPLSELLILGTNDAIPIDGSPVVLSADAEQAKWRTLNGCSSAATSTTAGPLTTTSWSNCDDDAAVQYGVIQNGRHQWPGAPQATGADAQYNAAEGIWSFFAAHPGPVSLTAPTATVRTLTMKSSGTKRWLSGLVDVRESRVTAKVVLKPIGGVKRTTSMALARSTGASRRALLQLPANAPAGRYTATVTLADSYGRTSTTTKTVVVPKP